MDHFANAPTYTRRHYLFSGEVQGVGFRRHAERFAQELELTGWVRNLPDGRVELLAEGEADLLDRMELKLRSRFLITEVARQELSPTREFDAFGIRR